MEPGREGVGRTERVRKRMRQRWTKRWSDPETESHRYIWIWMYLRERERGAGGRIRTRKGREREKEMEMYQRGMEQNRGRKRECDGNKDAKRDTEGPKGSLRFARESMSQIQGTERQAGMRALEARKQSEVPRRLRLQTSTDPNPRSTLPQRSCLSPDPRLTSSSLLWGELCQAVLPCTGLLLHPLQGPFIWLEAAPHP